MSVLIGAVVLAWIAQAGAAASTRELLIFIGFDPDRAVLLTTLTMGVAAAFAAGFVTGQRWPPALLGLAAMATFFGPSLWRETQTAMAAHGDQGSFDTLGWLVSLMSLVAASLLIAWAAATIACHIRRAVFVTWTDTAARITRRGWRGLANARLLLTLVVALVAGASTWVVAAMIDYSPDTLFHVGDPGVIALAPSGGSAPAPGLTAPSSSIDYQRLPAPWTGGTSDKASVSVYLPAGYSTSTTRYPVVYALPWGFDYWEQGIHVQEMLDGLIARKAIPPTIVVFAALSSGGPYVDTECADSVDGIEHIETYLATTLPAWADARFRTIADADHRTLFGFSQGGFCATMVLLRHTDTFHYAISFGGYYQAGVASPETVNAWRPWARDPKTLADHSPITEAGLVASADRPKLYLVLSGSVSQPFYGPQYSAFVDELATDGIPDTTLETEAAHSWPSVQADLPTALEDLARTQKARARG
jgi:enterochelin esterase-like enzyme